MKRKHIALLLIAIALIIAAYPVEVACHAPGQTCARPPIPGEDSYSVETSREPLLVYGLELMMPYTDIPIEYSHETKSYPLH